MFESSVLTQELWSFLLYDAIENWCPIYDSQGLVSKKSKDCNFSKLLVTNGNFVPVSQDHYPLPRHRYKEDATVEILGAEDFQDDYIGEGRRDELQERKKKSVEKKETNTGFLRYQSSQMIEKEFTTQEVLTRKAGTHPLDGEKITSKKLSSQGKEDQDIRTCKKKDLVFEKIFDSTDDNDNLETQSERINNLENTSQKNFQHLQKDKVKETRTEEDNLKFSKTFSENKKTESKKETVTINNLDNPTHQVCQTSEFSSEWLKNCLIRLNLSENPIETSDLENFGQKKLEAEKKRLKLELKGYDRSFSHLFGRDPSRTEKEPVRCLYAYYQKVKKIIAKKFAFTSHSEKINHPPSLTQRSDSTIQAEDTHRNIEHISVTNENMRLQKPGQEESKTMQASDGIYDPGKTPQVGPHTSVEEVNKSLNTKKHSNVRIVSSTNLEKEIESLNDNKKETKADTNLTSKMGHCSLRDKHQRLNRLQQEKKHLRQKLLSYQNRFCAETGRQVRLYKDIVPIEREYRRYKEVKREISEILDRDKVMRPNCQSQAL